MEMTNEPNGPIQTSAEPADRIEMRKIWQDLARGNPKNFEKALLWATAESKRVRGESGERFLSDDFAPPIDSAAEEMLRGHYLDELPFGMGGEIVLLTVYFRSWSEARARIEHEMEIAGIRPLMAEFHDRVFKEITNDD